MSVAGGFAVVAQLIYLLRKERNRKNRLAIQLQMRYNPKAELHHDCSKIHMHLHKTAAILTTGGSRECANNFSVRYNLHFDHNYYFPRYHRIYGEAIMPQVSVSEIRTTLDRLSKSIFPTSTPFPNISVASR